MFHHGPPLVVCSSFIAVLAGAIAYAVSRSLIVTLVAALALLIASVYVLLRTVYRAAEGEPPQTDSGPATPPGP